MTRSIVDNLATLNKAALVRIGVQLTDTLKLASERRLGVRLSPDEVDAVLGLLAGLERIRAEKHAGHLRGIVNIALAPFEE